MVVIQRWCFPIWSHYSWNSKMQLLCFLQTYIFLTKWKMSYVLLYNEHFTGICIIFCMQLHWYISFSKKPNEYHCMVLKPDSNIRAFLSLSNYFHYRWILKDSCWLTPGKICSSVSAAVWGLWRHVNNVVMQPMSCISEKMDCVFFMLIHFLRSIKSYLN